MFIWLFYSKKGFWFVCVLPCNTIILLFNLPISVLLCSGNIAIIWHIFILNLFEYLISLLSEAAEFYQICILSYVEWKRWFYQNNHSCGKKPSTPGIIIASRIFFRFKWRVRNYDLLWQNYISSTKKRSMTVIGEGPHFSFEFGTQYKKWNVI